MNPAKRRLIHRMPGLAAVALLLGLFAGSGAAQDKPQESDILIFRPLDNNQEVYLEHEDNLLVVPGGRVFLFQVEISAFSPLRGVWINGRRQRTGPGTWMLLETPQFLRPGINDIVVEARTGSGRHSRNFRVELRLLPGFAPTPEQ